ncbi:MAG: hypothetical protein ACHQ50_11070, partial [Fimbriimonadales bacterium]
MATQTSPGRFSWAHLGLWIVIAAVVGVGGTYAASLFVPEKKVTPEASPAASAQPRTPPPPPKIDFVEAGTMAANQAAFSKGDVHATADLGADDAMVVWVKAETPPAPGGAAPRASAPSGGGPG